jgi:hypothetical protein
MATLAASILGISHTGLQRWLESGDLPLVYTSNGRMEVPVGALLNMKQSVDGVRSTGQRTLHVIEPMVQESRRLAQQLRTDSPIDAGDPANRHRTPELLGLAYHRALARTLRRNHVEEARQTLRRWVAQGRIDPRYAAPWEELLDKTMPEIRQAMSADTAEMRDLRQNSPFAGMLSEPERREIVRAYQ